MIVKTEISHEKMRRELEVFFERTTQERRPVWIDWSELIILEHAPLPSGPPPSYVDPLTGLFIITNPYPGCLMTLLICCENEDLTWPIIIKGYKYYEH